MNTLRLMEYDKLSYEELYKKLEEIQQRIGDLQDDEDAIARTIDARICAETIRVQKACDKHALDASKIEYYFDPKRLQPKEAKPIIGGLVDFNNLITF